MRRLQRHPAGLRQPVEGGGGVRDRVDGEARGGDARRPAPRALRRQELLQAVQQLRVRHVPGHRGVPVRLRVHLAGAGVGGGGAGPRGCSHAVPFERAPGIRPLLAQLLRAAPVQPERGVPQRDVRPLRQRHGAQRDAVGRRPGGQRRLGLQRHAGERHGVRGRQLPARHGVRRLRPRHVPARTLRGGGAVVRRPRAGAGRGVHNRLLGERHSAGERLLPLRQRRQRAVQAPVQQEPRGLRRGLRLLLPGVGGRQV
mmetsp:Transcript_23517/g.80132  ORF Transcript_23517/g.80132 Transcript_23517/m.80132 type:complete len:256 (-) Transcript_23517:141-908(-)